MTRRQHITDRTVALRSMGCGRYLLEPATVLPLRKCANTRPWKQNIPIKRDVIELFLTLTISSYAHLIIDLERCIYFMINKQIPNRPCKLES